MYFKKIFTAWWERATDMVQKIPFSPLCITSAQYSGAAVARCGHTSFENNSITIIHKVWDYLLPHQKNIVCGRIIGISRSVQSLRSWSLQ